MVWCCDVRLEQSVMVLWFELVTDRCHTYEMATRSLNPMGTRCTPESCWYTPVIRRAVTSVSCLKWISPAQRNAACLFGYCRFEVRLRLFCGFLEACHLSLCLLLFQGYFPYAPTTPVKTGVNVSTWDPASQGGRGLSLQGHCRWSRNWASFPKLKWLFM